MDIINKIACNNNGGRTVVHIIGNRKLMDILFCYDTIPHEVKEEVNKTLEILESNYNSERMPYQSGGYVIVITSYEENVIDKLLSIYGLSFEWAEFDEIILDSKGYQWHHQYYQVATEYGITLFFCVPINNKGGSHEDMEKKVPAI